MLFITKMYRLIGTGKYQAYPVLLEYFFVVTGFVFSCC